MPRQVRKQIEGAQSGQEAVPQDHSAGNSVAATGGSSASSSSTPASAPHSVRALLDQLRELPSMTEAPDEQRSAAQLLQRMKEIAPIVDAWILAVREAEGFLSKAQLGKTAGLNDSNLQEHQLAVARQSSLTCNGARNSRAAGWYKVQCRILAEAVPAAVSQPLRMVETYGSMVARDASSSCCSGRWTVQ